MQGAEEAITYLAFAEEKHKGAMYVPKELREWGVHGQGVSTLFLIHIF